MINIKSKLRNLTRRKIKHENYDADLSMDSLNSVIPLKIDEHGRINIHQIENNNNNNIKLNEIANNDVSILMEKKEIKNQINDKVDLWCEHDIISQLLSLRNVSQHSSFIIYDEYYINSCFYFLCQGPPGKAARVGSREMLDLSKHRLLLTRNYSCHFIFI